MTPRRRFDELRLAMMMLTRLPMGQLRDPVPSLGEARWAFPLVGLPLGLAAWGVFAGAQAVDLPPLPAALCALAALAVLTGGLHHDGFADFADGMGGRDRAHRLEIMRDSRVGSYGVIALVFAIGLAATALSAVPVSAWGEILLVSMASRFAVLVLLDSLPPARPDGMGQLAATGATGTTWRAWIPGGAAILGLALTVGPLSLSILAAMGIAAVFVAWRAKTKLGGQTGDVLGAAQLASETAGWLALAACLR